MAFKLCPDCGQRQLQKLSATVYQCRACHTNYEQLTIRFRTKKSRSRRKRSA